MEPKRKVLDSHLQYTVGWLAPLSIERAAAEALLDEKHDQPRGFQQPEKDPSSYSWGNIGQHNIVIASLSSGVYGTNTAATTASCMLSTFPSIRFGLLVGIGGGIARPDDGKDIRLGDIVVSAPGGSTGGVVNYDLMKAKADGKELKGFLNSPPPLLLQAVTNLQSRHEQEPSAVPQILAKMREENQFMFTKRNNNPGYGYQGTENDHLFESSYKHVGGRDCRRCSSEKEVVREPRDIPENPDIHYGVIASGNTLVKDSDEQKELLNRISSLSDDCMCLEMEAAGLMNDFPCLVIRGICDYADSHKNDLWQRYAAATAAAFTKELLSVVVPRQVEGMQTAAQSVQEMTDDALKVVRQSRIKDWLQPHDASFDYQREKVKRGENTCQWLLESQAFSNWKKASKSSVLWTYGMPGCGKTVLSTAVIQHLHKTAQSEDHAVLYFFFAFGEKVKQSLDGMLRSFLFSLYRINEKVRKEVYRFFEYLHEEQPDRGCLVTLFWKMTEIFDNLSIVLDGLDEVQESNHRKDLFSWIKEAISLPHRRFRVAIMSRDEEDISFALRGTGQAIHIDSSMVTPDIEKYIDSEISQGELKKWEVVPEWQKKIKTTILERANGMFRLAACQMQELEGCPDLRNLQLCLKSLPKTLEETYNRMLSRISHKLLDGAMILLQVLLYSDRTLFVNEAIDLVSFGPEVSTVKLKKRMPDPKWIATYCRGLVTFHYTLRSRTTDFLDKEIHLAHFTVREFLTSDNVDQGFRSYFQEYKARESLFEVSITRIECIPSSDCIWPECDEEHPFAEHAAAYLMMQARAFEEKDKTFERLWSLLTNDKAYKIWLCHESPNTYWESVSAKRMRHYEGSKDGEQSEERLIASPLFIAVHLGLLRSVQKFLEKGYSFVSQPKEAPEAPMGFYLKKSSSSFRHREWDLYRSVIPQLSTREQDECHPITPLYAASERGHQAIVRELLQHSVPVNDIGGPLGTALVVACHQGHYEVVEEIFRAVPDVTALNFHDLLQAAAENGRLDIVQVLVSHGVRADHAADQYGSAIYAASLQGHCKTVQYLLNKSGDAPNIQGPPVENNTLQAYQNQLLRHGKGWSPSNAKYFDLKRRKESFEVEKILHSGSFEGPIPEESWELEPPSIRELKISKLCRYFDRIFGNALHAASHLGYCQVVEILLEKGLNPNTSGGIYRGALHAALAGYHERSAGDFFKKGTDVGMTGGRCESRRRVGTIQCHVVVVTMLLKAGATAPLDTEVLDDVWMMGDESVVLLLIKNMARANELAIDSSWELLLSSMTHIQSIEKTVSCSTPLLQRAINWNWKLVGQELVRQGFQITIQDAEGQNALHHAAKKGSPEASCTWMDILAQGVSVKLALLQGDCQGRTPLHTAVLYSGAKVVDKLIRMLKTPEESATPSVTEIKTNPGENILWTEAKPKLRSLLKLKCSARSIGGQSMLHLAAAHEDINIARIFLQVAEDLGIVQELLLDQDNASRTPTWIAAERGLSKQFKVLILFGANSRLTRKNIEALFKWMEHFPKFGFRLPGTRPILLSEEIPSLISAIRLHFAAETNDLHLAEEALSAEESCQDIVNSIDIVSGKTPLHWASESGFPKLVDLLLQPRCKVDVNVKDNAGNVPLHYAVAGAHHEISRILIGHGARIDTANSKDQKSLTLQAKEKIAH